MAFAINQVRLLALTSRKADLEYNISINSMEKMAIAREQSNLSQEYYSRLKSKNITYFANGQYNKMNYGYLMGYTCNTLATMYQNPAMLKKDNSMILTDSSGLVVLGSSYVSTMTKVLGSDCMDSSGKGGTFSMDKIPELIAAISSAGGQNAFTPDEVRNVMNGGTVKESEYNSKVLQTLTLEQKGTTTTNNTDTLTQMCQKLIDFYKPIFTAAAANGWTTAYNNEIDHNSDYISDGLVSGVLQLAQVNEYGGYDPDASLSYFVMSELVSESSDSSHREEVNAWYNAEKERISEKESWIDLELQDLSTELEVTNTEIESIKSMLEDDMKPFEWCT